LRAGREFCPPAPASGACGWLRRPQERSWVHATEQGELHAGARAAAGRGVAGCRRLRSARQQNHALGRCEGLPAVCWFMSLGFIRGCEGLPAVCWQLARFCSAGAWLEQRPGLEMLDWLLEGGR
jgi:hypothetical protein